jgi:hypothetical protein
MIRRDLKLTGKYLASLSPTTTQCVKEERCKRNKFGLDKTCILARPVSAPRRRRAKKYRIVCASCAPVPTPQQKGVSFVAFRTDGPEPTVQTCLSLFLYPRFVLGSLAKMEGSLITDLPRDKYVERCNNEPSIISIKAILKGSRLVCQRHERPPRLRIATPLSGAAFRCSWGRCVRLWRPLIEGLR